MCDRTFYHRSAPGGTHGPSGGAGDPRPLRRSPEQATGIAAGNAHEQRAGLGPHAVAGARPRRARAPNGRAVDLDRNVGVRRDLHLGAPEPGSDAIGMAARREGPGEPRAGARISPGHDRHVEQPVVGDRVGRDPDDVGVPAR